MVFPPNPFAAGAQPTMQAFNNPFANQTVVAKGAEPEFLPIVIQSVAENTENKGIKVLVYGRAGTGKTRLVGTAPYPIVLSAEGGLLSLRAQFPTLPVIEINSLQMLNSALNWAKTSAEAKNYWTICIDSASEIAEVVLTHEKTKSRDGRRAYGEMNDQVAAVFRGFRNLNGKHVYFSAKQDWEKDDLTGMMAWRPSMPGKTLTQSVPYFFDEVFQLMVFTDPTTNTVQSALRTQGDAQNDAKDRSGKLNPWEPPHLGSIFDKIMRVA